MRERAMRGAALAGAAGMMLVAVLSEGEREAGGSVTRGHAAGRVVERAEAPLGPRAMLIERAPGAALSWRLAPGARLFTVAGRDAGPYARDASPRSLPAPATDRELEPAD